MRSAAVFLFVFGFFLLMVRADDMVAGDYTKRASEKRTSGDLPGALADYDKAIELGPDLPDAYFARGLTYFEQGDWNLAVADFCKSDELRRSRYINIHLLIWAARVHTGERTAADKELGLQVALDTVGERNNSSSTTSLPEQETFDEAVSAFDMDNKWPRDLHWAEPTGASKQRKPLRSAAFVNGWTVAAEKFLLGRMKERDFFSFPPSAFKDIPSRQQYWPPGKHSCEALFYAGLKRWLDGDRKTAMKYLKECDTADGPEHLVERELARTELKFLAAGQ